MKSLLLFILFFIFSSASLADEVIEVKSTIPLQTTQKESIHLANISQQSIQTLEKIEKISTTLDKNELVKEIQTALPSYSKAIDDLLHDNIYKDLTKLDIRTLQKSYNDLSVYLLSLHKWNEALQTQIELYQDKDIQIQTLSLKWKKIATLAKKEEAPTAILEQITKVEKELHHVEKSIKKTFDNLLTDSNLITVQIAKIDKLMEALKQIEIALANNVLKQNELPYFTTLTQVDFFIVHYFHQIYTIYLENFQHFYNYLDTHENGLLALYLSLFLLSSFIFYFYYLYKKEKLFVYSDSIYKKEFFFIKRPISTLLIIQALINVFIFMDMPEIIMSTHLLFILIPIFRIIQVVSSKEIVKYFYLFFSLYLLYLIQKSATGYSIENRSFVLLLTILFIVFHINLIKNRILDFIVKPFLLKFSYRLLYIFIIALFVSILANLYGTVLLSFRLMGFAFVSIYSAIIFYSLYIILSGYIIIMLRRHMATATNLVEDFSIKVETNTIKIIKLIMFIWWVKVIIRNIGLYPYLIELKNSFLALTWQVSTTTISTDAIMDFIVVLLGTWLLARFTNALLIVEIFSRFNFPRGIPTAIQTVVNYMILGTGVIIALSSLGITTEQFTLVFGALGVGIGFGLRNIIANFVSGIIMVFERPIQLGDTIEINNSLGSVQSIGARSSTIKTFDGSEVIIPNADFIAKEIINWTLSDERRRKILDFKVAFDSDIEKVLAIMKEIASAHPDVLKDPTPLATFKGFGEYYLEFKLYFWLTDNLIVAQSDIAIAIHKALKEENIQMPTPKQEIKQS